MSNLKVISEPWKDFGGEDTEALYLDVDRQFHSMNPVGIENMRRIIQKNGWTEVK